MGTRKMLLPLVLLTVSAHVSAQSIEEIDGNLAAYLEKITYWDEYNSNDTSVSREDSLDKVNTDLSNYLRKIALAKPQTLKADFPKAEKKLAVVTSDDGKLRLYSWDSRMGGTMRDYEDYAQYRSAKGIMFVSMKDTAVEDDYGGDYRSITTIHAAGKTVYLVQDYSIISTKDRAESITAYTIEGDLLKKINIFHTKTKSFNSIGYGYDCFSSAEKFPNRDIPTIHLTKDNQKLYIPVVSGPTNEDVTDKYLVYIFDGNNYVFNKNLK